MSAFRKTDKPEPLPEQGLSPERLDAVSGGGVYGSVANAYNDSGVDGAAGSANPNGAAGVTFTCPGLAPHANLNVNTDDLPIPDGLKAALEIIRQGGLK